MKKISNLPIKYKLVLWSSLLLFISFVCYNILQYSVLNSWMVAEENNVIQQKMKETQGYFHERSKANALTEQEVKKSSAYLYRLSGNHQMIRILNAKGTTILSASQDVPDEKIPIKSVSSEEYDQIQSSENRFLILRSPLPMNKENGTIEIIQSMEIFDGLLNKFLLVMLSAGLGSIVLSWFGGVLIAKQLLKSVKNILQTMKKIQKTGLHERVPSNGTQDEMTEIGELFNVTMDKLEESFLQQKRFVEDASHELRTPIAVIRGNLTMLKRWGKNDLQLLEESLDSTLEEVQHLSDLIAELLEQSKAESEKQNEPIEWINPVPIIENTLRNFKSLHNEFEFILDMKNIEGHVIPIQPRHLDQILVILLDNAVKYSSENKWIKCSVERLDHFVQIKIIDKGIGIPQQDIPFILNRFYRVDKARSRKQGGFGLGLSIANRLIEKYNGTIHIESKVNEGTTAILKLVSKN
ncbi:HAMP domain-containing sensor histidine kinase [Peribacillus kribbensis]|uniref:HAMP domain-containing sensor histidine kinase n=1 Tax=Peribacillus kribbensis TaxID=356658 RepID=UPI00040029F3|nr:HAMP domain-containing histidine kinase [Peribacillus kribbensis]